MTFLATPAYTNFSYKFSKAFSNVYSYDKIKIPEVKSPKADKRILVIIDQVPSESMQSKKLLDGYTGEVLSILEKTARRFYKKHTIPTFSWKAISFNAFKTAGETKEFQEEARSEFVQRLKVAIYSYEPDTIIIFGDSAFRAMFPKVIELSNGVAACWHGFVLDQTLYLEDLPASYKHNFKKKSISFKVVPNLSLSRIVSCEPQSCALLGYMIKHLLTGILGYNPYSIDTKAIANHIPVFIDTLEKFNKLMDVLELCPVVAVDTETRNLNKVTNTLLTIQFAKCTKYGYFLPVFHKDTPFTKKELKVIVTRLRQFFEGVNENKYHIYTNALFDLNVLRKALNCAIMYNPVFDIFSGEYALDENKKFLETVAGTQYYSLSNISVQYGCIEYYTSDFGKKHRGSIWNHALDEALIRYGTLDVVIPFAIHEQQLRIAQDLGHSKYESLVTEQLSDLLHGFSKMTETGSKIDIDYLFKLQIPNSPIEKVIADMEQELLDTPEAKKLEKYLAKEAGIPTKGLFATDEHNVRQVDLRKIKHKELLFFKFLNLKVLSKGKSDRPKLDQTFQKTYAEVPAVKMYVNLEKAKKLKNAFVKSFIKLLNSDEDVKYDSCIRPNFHYVKVITGRTSASDPNLQQVPSHSELGKHIKRLFVAPEGYLYLKVDYRVHEVRGWGLIALDTSLASVFLEAKKLRDSYRLHPTEELKTRLKYEADIHVMNASYFFKLSHEKAAEKTIRNSVKQVIFGLIYQMSVTTLAKNLKQEVAATQTLVDNFNKRFPRGMQWITKAKSFAKKNLYYENPLGFRRHLWGYLLPKSIKDASKIYGSMDRRAVNSPIQGMCAQFIAIGIRYLDKLVYNILVKEDREVKLKVCNSVHDSLENIAGYDNFLESIDLVETALTKGVRQVVLKRHGFKFVVDLEIDFEIGATLADTKAWDTSIVDLEKIVFESLCIQKFDLRHDISVVACMDSIFLEGWERAPEWMKQQAKSIGWRYDRDSIKEKYKTVKKTYKANNH